MLATGGARKGQGNPGFAPTTLRTSRAKARQGSPNPRDRGRRDSTPHPPSRCLGAAAIGHCAKAPTFALSKHASQSPGSSPKLSYPRGTVLPGSIVIQPLDCEHALGRTLFYCCEHTIRLRDALAPATTHSENHHAVCSVLHRLQSISPRLWPSTRPGGARGDSRRTYSSAGARPKSRPPRRQRKRKATRTWRVPGLPHEELGGSSTFPTTLT